MNRPQLQPACVCAPTFAQELPTLARCLLATAHSDEALLWQPPAELTQHDAASAQTSPLVGRNGRVAIRRRRRRVASAGLTTSSRPASTSAEATPAVETTAELVVGETPRSFRAPAQECADGVGLDDSYSRRACALSLRHQLSPLLNCAHNFHSARRASRRPRELRYLFASIELVSGLRARVSSRPLASRPIAAGHLRRIGQSEVRSHWPTRSSEGGRRVQSHAPSRPWPGASATDCERASAITVRVVPSCSSRRTRSIISKFNCSPCLLFVRVYHFFPLLTGMMTVLLVAMMMRRSRYCHTGGTHEIDKTR